MKVTKPLLKSGSASQAELHADKPSPKKSGFVDAVFTAKNWAMRGNPTKAAASLRTAGFNRLRLDVRSAILQLMSSGFGHETGRWFGVMQAQLLPPNTELPRVGMGAAVQTAINWTMRGNPDKAAAALKQAGWSTLRPDVQEALVALVQDQFAAENRGWFALVVKSLNAK